MSGISIRQSGMALATVAAIESGGVGSSDIADGSVANADLADMSQSTFKGRKAGAGVGAPQDMSVSEAQTVLADGWAYLSLGSSPATSGLLRVPHASNVIYGLRQGGGGVREIVLFGQDGNNIVTVGDNLASPGAVWIRGADRVRLVTGVSPTRSLDWVGGALTFINVSSGNGQNMPITGQGTTAVSGNGGLLQLRGGRAGAGGTPGGVTIGANRDDSTIDIGVAVGSSGSAAQLAFFGGSLATKPTVTGSRGSNAALASLLTALAGLGLITDSSS